MYVLKRKKLYSFSAKFAGERLCTISCFSKQRRRSLTLYWCAMTRPSASLLHKNYDLERKKEREHLLITSLSVLYIISILFIRREVEKKEKRKMTERLN